MASGINVNITASIKGLTDSLEGASRQIKKSTEEWTKSFDSLGKTVENLKAPFLALAAVWGAGKMFGDAVKTAGEWNMAAEKVSKTLGVTTQEASALNLVLDDLGIEQSQYINATVYMTRQIARGGDAFKKLGIDIRDSGGQLRPVQDIMRDSIDKLNDLKAGVDRNAAGLQLFGKGWVEVQDVLRLTREEMEGARKDAEDLHLVVGPEGAARARAYQRALGDIKDVQMALQVQMGNELMPTYLAVSKWMVSTGPNAATGLAAAIKTVITVFMELKMIVEVVVTVASALIFTLIDGFTALGSAFINLVKGEYSAAVQDLKNGASAIKGDWVAAGQNIGQSWEEMATGIRSLWVDPPKAPEGKAPAPDAGGRYEPVESNKDFFTKAKEGLAALRDLWEEEGTYTTAMEIQYWQARLKQVAAGSDAYKAIVAEMYRLSGEKRKQDLNEALSAAKLAQASALTGLEMEADALTQRKRLGEVGAEEEIRSLLELERQKFQVRKMSLEAMMALQDLEPQKRSEIQAQLLQAEAEFNKRRGALQTDLLLQQREQVNQFMQPFVQGFNSGIQAMLEGTLSFKDAIRGIYGMMRQALAQAISGMISDWIAGLAKQLAAWIANKATELGIFTSTETAKTATGVAGSVTRGTASAMEGGIAAGATAAQTPGIGWLIALPVAGAVMAGLIGMLASAAGGYDIPGGLNPIVQTHAREMILPAKYADVIRGMANGGSEGGGSGAGPTNVTFNLSGVIDGDHLVRTLTSNAGQAALTKAINQAARNGRGQQG